MFFVGFQSKSAVSSLLARAGIEVNGGHSWDIQVKSDGFYDEVARGGMMGLGDSYVHGDWECKDLSSFFYRAFRAGLLEYLSSAWPVKLMKLKERLLNFQNGARAPKNACDHYGKGNALFEAMLGNRMIYTCAVWQDPVTLNDSETLDCVQERKLELVARKLALESGMHVLDLGGGWGGFAGYIAEKYGVHVTTVTPVGEQVDYIQARYGHLPVTAVKADYRTMNRKFDRVAAVGLLEHVGPKNHRTFMDVVCRCLKDGGIALAHAITRSDLTVPLIDPWTQERIFPGGYIPTLVQICRAAEGTFDIVDVHEIGRHYDKTLMHWHENFEDSWPKLKDTYGEEFHRLWRYYLLSCAGAFRARKVLLHQVVLVKKGSELVYQPVR